MKSMKPLLSIFMILIFLVSVTSAACPRACKDTSSGNATCNVTISSLKATCSPCTAPTTISITGNVNGKASNINCNVYDENGTAIKTCSATCSKMYCHIYVKKAGTYTVTISATDKAGCTISKSTSVTVKEPEKCKPCFTYSKTGKTLKFKDCSTGNIYSRYWNFGDGKTYKGTNPTHTYKKAGKYTVTLKLYGPGCPDGIKTYQQVVIR